MKPPAENSGLARLVSVQPHERATLWWAFIYFYCLLCSYYIIRPIRDAMGIQAGIESLEWLYLVAILVMLPLVPLFGWLTSRWPRRIFLPWIYLFFISNLLLFYAAFRLLPEQSGLPKAFYLWVNVFNLFVVSVFWSYMADVFNDEQAKRLFGFIAAGGSAGAITGPLITSFLIERIGQNTLLLVSASFLVLAIACIARIARSKESMTELSTASTELTKAVGNSAAAQDNESLKGGLWAGITLVFKSRYLMGICLLVLSYSVLSTFLYFQQVQIISDYVADTAQRTIMFARVDLLVNVLTIVCQLFLTGRLMKTAGLGWTLALVPLLLAFGLLMLGLAPALGLSMLVVVIGLQVVRRTGYYAVINPAREALFVVLSREEKYKAKNFIDTSVYRGGDAVSAGLSGVLRSAGFSIANIALLAVPLALAWAAVSVWLGRRHDAIVAADQPLAAAVRPVS